MKYAILLSIALIAACSGGGSEQTKTPTLFILGDSLCSDKESWANTLPYHKDVLCHGGWKATQAEYVDIVLSFEADIFINALGINDAGAIYLGDESLSEFIDAYSRHNQQAADKGMIVICLMPPLTNWAILQPHIMLIHDAIQNMCQNALHSAPSDHSDGLHYTDASQELNRQIITNYINSLNFNALYPE